MQTDTPKKPRGFAAMSPEKRKAIAALGRPLREAIVLTIQGARGNSWPRWRIEGGALEARLRARYRSRTPRRPEGRPGFPSSQGARCRGQGEHPSLTAGLAASCFPVVKPEADGAEPRRRSAPRARSSPHDAPKGKRCFESASFPSRRSERAHSSESATLCSRSRRALAKLARRHISYIVNVSYTGAALTAARVVHL